MSKIIIIWKICVFLLHSKNCRLARKFRSTWWHFRCDSETVLTHTRQMKWRHLSHALSFTFHLLCRLEVTPLKEKEEKRKSETWYNIKIRSEMLWRRAKYKPHIEPFLRALMSNNIDLILQWTNDLTGWMVIIEQMSLNLRQNWYIVILKRCWVFK